MQSAESKNIVLRCCAYAGIGPEHKAADFVVHVRAMPLCARHGRHAATQQYFVLMARHGGGVTELVYEYNRHVETCVRKGPFTDGNIGMLRSMSEDCLSAMLLLLGDANRRTARYAKRVSIEVVRHRRDFSSGWRWLMSGVESPAVFETAEGAPALAPAVVPQPQLDGDWLGLALASHGGGIEVVAEEAADQDPAWIERELARILEESDLAPLRDIVQDVEDFTAQAQEETLDSEKNADEAAIASEADAGADRDAEGDGDDGEEVQQGELVSEDPDSVALAVGLRDVGGWRFVRAEDALMR